MAASSFLPKRILTLLVNVQSSLLHCISSQPSRLQIRNIFGWKVLKLKFHLLLARPGSLVPRVGQGRALLKRVW